MTGFEHGLLAGCVVLALFLAHRLSRLTQRLSTVERWASVNSDRLLELKRRVDAATGGARGERGP